MGADRIASSSLLLQKALLVLTPRALCLSSGWMLFTSRSSQGSLSVIAQDQGRGCLSRDVTMGSDCICAACVCVVCEFSCLLRCDGGCICLSVDQGSSHPSICAILAHFAHRFTHCPSPLCSELAGDWKLGRREKPGYFSSSLSAFDSVSISSCISL